MGGAIEFFARQGVLMTTAKGHEEGEEGKNLS